MCNIHPFNSEQIDDPVDELGAESMSQYESEEVKFTRLDEKQWAAIEAVLPRTVYTRNASADDARRFVEAALWVMATGRFWTELPEAVYGPWRKNYVRSNRWIYRGMWLTVINALGPDSELAVMISNYMNSQLERHRKFGRRNNFRDESGEPEN